jgi:diacylglycerol kinase (ATP)
MSDQTNMAASINEQQNAVPESANDTAAQPFKRIYVIVNPAAGQDRPILGVFNKAFHDSGAEWDMGITKQAGDGFKMAQDAVAAGADVVGVYGGDGTVMEVANGVAGTGIPLAIFPGGTANVMSVELGIPSDLAEAAALVCGTQYAIRDVDMGRCDGRYFLLRLGIGFEADMINNADRDSKDKRGKLAYILSGLQTIPKRTVSHYTMSLDGQVVESDGVTCMIANSGNFGLPGLSLSKKIDVSDGLLDVLIIRDTDIGSLLSVAASAIGVADPLQHWQAKHVTLTADPPQAIICDGEPLKDTPVSADIAEHVLRVVVPVQAAAARDIPPPAPGQ